MSPGVLSLTSGSVPEGMAKLFPTGQDWPQPLACVTSSSDGGSDFWPGGTAAP